VRIVFLLIIAAAIIFTDFFPSTLDKKYQIILGSGLIVYALVRAYLEFKNAREYTEDEE